MYNIVIVIKDGVVASIKSDYKDLTIVTINKDHPEGVDRDFDSYQGFARDMYKSLPFEIEF